MKSYRIAVLAGTYYAVEQNTENTEDELAVMQGQGFVLLEPEFRALDAEQAVIIARANEDAKQDKKIENQEQGRKAKIDSDVKRYLALFVIAVTLILGLPFTLGYFDGLEKATQSGSTCADDMLSKSIVNVLADGAIGLMKYTDTYVPAYSEGLVLGIKHVLLSCTKEPNKIDEPPSPVVVNKSFSKFIIQDVNLAVLDGYKTTIVLSAKDLDRLESSFYDTGALKESVNLVLEYFSKALERGELTVLVEGNDKSSIVTRCIPTHLHLRPQQLGFELIEALRVANAQIQNKDYGEVRDSACSSLNF